MNTSFPRLLKGKIYKVRLETFDGNNSETLQPSILWETDCCYNLQFIKAQCNQVSYE